MDLSEQLDTLASDTVTNPYRNAPPAPRSQKARRRVSQLAGAVAFLWMISMARLAIAYEKEERLSFEPALAALLSVAPPIALFCRSIRDAVFDDIG